MQKRLEGFVFDLENYHIVSETDRALYQQRGSMIRDARQRREVKIKQYQKEKELRSKLEASKRILLMSFLLQLVLDYLQATRDTTRRS